MAKSKILTWQSRLCRDRQALRLAALATAPLIGEPLGERHYADKLPFICRSIDHPQCVAAASTPPPCDTEHEQMAPWTAPLRISGKNCFASETNLSSKLVQLKAQSFRPNSCLYTIQRSVHIAFKCPYSCMAFRCGSVSDASITDPDISFPIAIYPCLLPPRGPNALPRIRLVGRLSDHSSMSAWASRFAFSMAAHSSAQDPASKPSLASITPAWSRQIRMCRCALSRCSLMST